MSRYSPTIAHETPDTSLASAIAGLYGGYQNAKALKQQKEGENRKRSIEDWALRQQIESNPRYTTDQPAPPETPPIMRGAQPGMAGQKGKSAPSVFRGSGVGMQPNAAPPVDLATAIEQTQPSTDVSKPQFLPGQFVRNAGSFTDRPVFPVPGKAPQGPEPVANVGGTDVYRNPRYRTDAQQLADLLDTVHQARSGDQGAMDQLMVTRPSIYDVLSGSGNFTPDQLSSAGVPEGAIPAATSDRTLGRQLVSNYNHPSPGSQPGVKFTPDQLRAGKVPEGLIPAAVADPVLGRNLLETYNKPGAQGAAGSNAQDAIARRQVVTSAINAVNDLSRYYDPQKSADRANFDAEVQRVVSLYGFNSIQELQDAANALRKPRTTRPERGGRNVRDPRVPAQERVDELLKRGYTNAEILQIMKDEGY